MPGRSTSASLSLDDAASQLNLSRKQLAGFVTALDIKKQRGDDRRAYLHPQDVEKIAAFRSEKMNPAYSGLTFMSDLPSPATMKKDYRVYATDGFASNDTLYKVIVYISQNGAAIPPKLFRNRTMEKEIPSHPLLDKLDRPNPEQSGVEYRESILGWYLITANAFQYAIRKGITGPPDELWTLESWKVRPLLSRLRGTTGYRYEDFSDEQNPIPAENIAHMRSWNPTSPSFGLSAIEPGSLLIDQQTSARRWNLALLQNYAKPPGAWVTDAILSPNDRSKTENKINEKMSGYRNAGRVPLLDAGLKWVNSAVPPSELDWLKSIQYNAGQIANLYNIPPQLIGDTSATTYNNMQEAKAASYTEAIFPALDKLYAIWNVWLLPMYPDLKGAFLSYDKETVEVVQEAIQARLTAAAERATKVWSQGAASTCTLNEAREMMGLPKDPQGDIYRIGSVLVQQDELDTYAEQSLQKPATAPALVPENILDAPPPEPAATKPQGENNHGKPDKPGDHHSGNSSDNAHDSHSTGSNDSGKGGTHKVHALPHGSEPVAVEASRLGKRPTQHGDGGRNTAVPAPRKASLGGAETTHLLWQCDASACEFCLENDGQVIAVGDSFNNGCSSPDDSHRFCRCEAVELSIPDEADADGLSVLALATLYGVGLVASRHDRDVAEQSREDAEDEDDSGEEDYAKSTIQPLVARPSNPRKQRAREYQQFIREALV